MTPENLREKIISLISHHSENKGERLEVVIVSLSKYFDESRDSFCLHFEDNDFECGKFFKTKRQAIDFCQKFNLKIKEEGK